VQYATPRSGRRIVEFIIPSAGKGQPAIRLNTGDTAQVLTLLRDNRETSWDAGTLLARGDRVVMAIGDEGFEGEMGSSGIWETAGRMKIVIGGCGRVGAQLADILSLDDHQVTVIDNDSGAFRRLSKTYAGEAIEGVAFDEGTLEQAGIREADAFAAITDYDNANLMAAEVAEHIFQVPRVIARLYNPDKEATYQALGMDYLCGTKLLAQAILEKLVRPLVRTRGQCANNTLNIVEFDYPRAWKSRTAQRLREDPGIRVAWVRRGEETILAGQDFACRVGDEVTALASSRVLLRLERKLKNLEGR
jgi:trk system potassium uptake protein TrkA